MALIELDISETSKFITILGFYIVVLGLFSYTIKERLFISDAMVCMAIGIIVGPIGTNWVSTWRWTSGNEGIRNNITYEIMRIAIGIQVLFCGINLPGKYLKTAWKSIAILLVPVLTAAWLISSAIIFALIPGLSFLDCLVIGSCVAPTDPVLANSIVKGRFAEDHVPKHVRDLLAAESGANDGLGVPFVYLAIFLMRRRIENYSVGEAVRRWVISTILYDIVLSVAIGAILGYLARKSLKFAERRNLIDHESFLAYGVGLVFFTLGVDGMLGSDDLLACFIAGSSFTWDDWFREETEDHSFQNVIDQLINSAVFVYLGTILPWSEFGDKTIGLTAGKLVAVTFLILLIRRVPITLITFKWMPDIRSWREAGFAGWFGPIGVSAVYYAQLALREVPEERTRLRQVVVPIVYMVVLGSVCVHGISIPILKYRALVKTYSRTNSASSFRLGSRKSTMPVAADVTKASGAQEIDPAIAKRSDGQHIRIDIATARPFASVVPEPPPLDPTEEEDVSAQFQPRPQNPLPPPPGKEERS